MNFRNLATLDNARAWKAANEKLTFTADLLGEAKLPNDSTACAALEELFEATLKKARPLAYWCQCERPKRGAYSTCQRCGKEYR